MDNAIFPREIQEIEEPPNRMTMSCIFALDAS